ncbi:hypothetical protein GCM10023191_042570 [Actinoallomurus oryzae]|uniref:Uncharacterized protein n=2 Tax=Actinoallomurus oryzae TaxID=502180 RepID=A0ABP8Q5Z4_9ACTN
MAAMEHTDGNGRTPLVAILGCLGTAVFFEAVTVLATQDKTVRAASPWQDDPYDAVVSLTQLAVPMLALVIALRLAAWRAPGGPDREQQTARAAGVMTALVGITLVFEWAAVVARAHAPSWDTWTSVLIGGLVAASLLTVTVTAMLARGRRPRGSSRRWRHDWLGDVVLLCARVPVLRRWAGPDAAAWVRRRAMTVFVTLSVLAAAAVTGSQAIGERWTDPLLIAWMLVVQTASDLAFCVISNAVAGFVARPPRTRTRRVVETAVVAGCVAIHLATAFRDALWPGARPLTSVPDLVALTLGTGLLTSLVVAGTRLAPARHPDPPAGPGDGPAHPLTQH